MTSTYFEGSAKGNLQAKRGYSRDGRPDCAQVCIGLVASREGLPLAFEIFDGNRVDVTTTQEMIQIMEAKYGKADRIWVMDRGMVSEDNLEYMRQKGARYLVGTPKSMLKKFEQELLSQDWEEVQPGVEVRLCPSHEDKGETFVLCRSQGRKEKENALLNRFVGNMETSLAKMVARTHILVCFLALAMWRTLQQWMKASGLGTAPRKLLDEMKEIKSLDGVLLPTGEVSLYFLDEPNFFLL
ncbi:MAG: IS1634 family transposase [Proteobacteria bacterium]|nr:IS1634 family transposase [Pseudomonadota bacterium]